MNRLADRLTLCLTELKGAAPGEAPGAAPTEYGSGYIIAGARNEFCSRILNVKAVPYGVVE